MLTAPLRVWVVLLVLRCRYRNDCGVGGEDCSLCMVSSVASAYWIRWMLVAAADDSDTIHLARGAPRRWYLPPAADTADDTTDDTTDTNSTAANPRAWGITKAPTRLGQATFTIGVNVVDGSKGAKGAGLAGSVSISPNYSGGVVRATRVTVKLRSRTAATPLTAVTVTGGAVTLEGWFPGNETALFRLAAGGALPCNFTFVAV